jgi:hypothetical protein
MMISIVPMPFLLSCYLSESLSMPCSAPPGSTVPEPKTETPAQGRGECPAPEVVSREICGASLLSYLLLKVTMPH